MSDKQAAQNWARTFYAASNTMPPVESLAVAHLFGQQFTEKRHLKELAKRVLPVLERIMWGNYIPACDSHGCVDCARTADEGHKEDCELAATIEELRKIVCTERKER